VPRGRGDARRTSEGRFPHPATGRANPPPVGRAPAGMGRPLRPARQGPHQEGEIPPHLPLLRQAAQTSQGSLRRRRTPPPPLPRPGSLVLRGVPGFHRLHQELPLGLQAPLLQKVSRHRAPHGLRVPQSGLMTEGEKAASEAHPELVRNTFKRTHRWDRVLRDQDELALLQREGKLLHVLFSSLPDDLALYDKPMARNVQLWLPDGTLLLDGPSATPEQVRHAMQTVTAGGVFGYRFLCPAMRVGSHEVYWHRPLVGFQGHKDEHPTMLADAPLGYLTAYPTQPPASHDEEESG